MRLAILALIIIVGALASYAELVSGSGRPPVEEYRLSVGKDLSAAPGIACQHNCPPAVVSSVDQTPLR